MSTHSQLEAVALPSRPVRSLNVLVVDEAFPYPTRAGKAIRTWNLLRALAQQHKVTFVSHGTDEGASEAARSANIKLVSVAGVRELRGFQLYADLGLNVFSKDPYSVSKHYSQRLEMQLRSIVDTERFDLVHCEWTPYLKACFSAELDSRLPILVTTHNIEGQIWSRRAETSSNAASRWFFSMQAAKMQSFEARSLRRVDWVTACTELDAEVLRRFNPGGVSLVENGVDVDYFAPGSAVESDDEILFMASLDWQPNIDSLKFFLGDIFPSIQKRLPSAHLTIVGRKPPLSLKSELVGKEGVNLIGEVADVRPYLQRASVVIVPLRVGAGSRIKILESLGMSKAVVSTSIGAEGLALEDGKHIRIADTPDGFAACTCELMRNAEQRRFLGQQGRALVVERYSWRRAANALEQAWLNAVEAGNKRLGRSA